MNGALEVEAKARPRHMRGLLPLALWLGTYFSLDVLWDALQAPHPQPALHLALIQIAQVATAPLFARWILVRVFGTWARVSKRERTVVRMVDAVAVAWTGYVVGVWVTLRQLQAPGAFDS